MRCPRCKKILTKAEAICYRGICEDCWTSGGPATKKDRFPHAPAQGYAIKHFEPDDLKRITNQQQEEKEINEDRD